MQRGLKYVVAGVVGTLLTGGLSACSGEVTSQMQPSVGSHRASATAPAGSSAPGATRSPRQGVDPSAAAAAQQREVPAPTGPVRLGAGGTVPAVTFTPTSQAVGQRFDAVAPLLSASGVAPTVMRASLSGKAVADVAVFTLDASRVASATYRGQVLVQAVQQLSRSTAQSETLFGRESACAAGKTPVCAAIDGGHALVVLPRQSPATLTTTRDVVVAYLSTGGVQATPSPVHT